MQFFIRINLFIRIYLFNPDIFNQIYHERVYLCFMCPTIVSIQLSLPILHDLRFLSLNLLATLLPMIEGDVFMFMLLLLLSSRFCSSSHTFCFCSCVTMICSVILVVVVVVLLHSFIVFSRLFSAVIVLLLICSFTRSFVRPSVSLSVCPFACLFVSKQKSLQQHPTTATTTQHWGCRSCCCEKIVFIL